MNDIPVQIDRQGNLIKEKDVKMNENERNSIIQIELGEKNITYINHGSRKLVMYSPTQTILVTRQITYLGGKWPADKKRIQLGKPIQEIYQQFSLNYGIRIIGIYRYEDNIIYVDFDPERYMKAKSNNSSAHICVDDLQKGMKKNYYHKIDRKKHSLKVIQQGTLGEYLVTIGNG